MDMAWDIESWKPVNSIDYTKHWAKEIWGETLSGEIAAIKNEYYLLAASGKPEHMNAVSFTYQQLIVRLKRYAALQSKADIIRKKIPAQLQDAYFQLILYPVHAAALMNKKILYSRLSFHPNADNDFPGASQKARSAFDSIQYITGFYNRQIANGKWNGIMDWMPRDQEVFKMPLVYDGASKEQTDSLRIVFFNEHPPALVLSMNDAVALFETGNMKFEKIKGLGISENALASRATSPAGTSDAYVQFNINMNGKYRVVIKSLPTFDITGSQKLRYAIAVNEELGQEINLHTETDSREWRQNVLRGFSKGESIHDFDKEINLLRVYIKDGGFVFNTIEFYKL
jgi:hypothetical protein